MTKTVTTGKATDLITFTRSTTGTYLDSVKYGDELVTNGTFDTDTSSWTAYRNATLSTDSSRLKVLASSATAGGSASQQITTKVGHTYKLSVDVVEIQTGQTARIAVGSASGDLGSGLGTDIINDNGVAVGTQVYYFTATTTSPFIIVCAQTNTEKHVLFDNISVKEIIGNQGTSGEPLLRTADTNEPRIEYDADGNLKGLLIEEQRTNNLTNSNNASVLDLNASGITTAVNSSEVQAPSNTETVIKLNKTSGGYGYARTSYTTVTYAQTFSVFVKKGTARYVGLRQLNTVGSHRHTTFDLDTKTWTHTGYSDTRGYQDYGNGWLRIWVTDNSNTKSWASVAIVDASGEENSSPTGTLYIYGYQREAGTFPTSYIPTSGSTVTRNADIANVNPSTFELNQNESTLLVSGTSMPTRGVGTVKEFWCASLHTASGYANMRFYSGGVANSAVQDAVGFDSGVQFDTTGASISPPVEFTSVLAIKDNDVGYANQSMTGVNIDTSSTFSDFNNLRIGSTGSGSYLNGHIKSVKYYPVRLTNNQLKALTQ